MLDDMTNSLAIVDEAFYINTDHKLATPFSTHDHNH